MDSPVRGDAVSLVYEAVEDGVGEVGSLMTPCQWLPAGGSDPPWRPKAAFHAIAARYGREG